MSLDDYSSAELRRELDNRGDGQDVGRCWCGKWDAYVGAYDADGYTVRCYGCVRAVARCTCR